MATRRGDLQLQSHLARLARELHRVTGSEPPCRFGGTSSRRTEGRDGPLAAVLRRQKVLATGAGKEGDGSRVA